MKVRNARGRRVAGGSRIGRIVVLEVAWTDFGGCVKRRGVPNAGDEVYGGGDAVTAGRPGRVVVWTSMNDRKRSL